MALARANGKSPNGSQAGQANGHQSNGLYEADVCATYRVVLESLDAGFDPAGWRNRFMEGVSKVIGANRALSNIMPADPSHNGKQIPLMMTYVSDPLDQPLMNRFFAEMRVPDDPATPVIMARWGEPQTALISQLVERETWLASPYIQRVYLGCNVYDFIHSRVPLPDLGFVSVLGFARWKGQPLFTERERRIVEIAHQEIASRVAVPDERMSDEFYALPPRLQELATHLRGPMSEKQIAAAMRLSIHTLHNYVKKVYRRLDVSSRTEAIHAMRSRDGRSGTRHEVVLA